MVVTVMNTSRGLFCFGRSAFTISVRYKNRINVQKPRPPHYERQKIETLVRPIYFEKGEKASWSLPLAKQCIKEEEVALRKKSNEVNPYEVLLAKDLQNWLFNSKLIAFFHTNPIKFDPKFEVEVKLRKENMYIKRYGKHTVAMAVEGTKYTSVLQLFQSHTEIVFCNEPKVDKLLKISSKMSSHVLLAAIVEDRFLSISQLKALSQLKDITTARAQLVSLLNTAQSQLVAGLTYHQTNLVGGLQQYADSGRKDETVTPSLASETPSSTSETSSSTPETPSSTSETEKS